MNNEIMIIPNDVKIIRLTQGVDIYQHLTNEVKETLRLYIEGLLKLQSGMAYCHTHAVFTLAAEGKNIFCTYYFYNNTLMLSYDD